MKQAILQLSCVRDLVDIVAGKIYYSDIMSQILKQIALCIENGKIDMDSPHPAEMSGEKGADELTEEALAEGALPQDILSKSLILGMSRVGEKFRNNEIYLPDVLMSARAMNAGMKHIKPYFIRGKVKYKGKIVLGTVAGDLHDIGKKIVGMFFAGGGWQVIDCGVDVSQEQYIQAVRDHQPKAIGMSALLTTTMINMENIAAAVRAEFPEIKILVGGAPVTQSFADRIGADIYSADPQGALDKLNL